MELNYYFHRSRSDHRFRRGRSIIWTLSSSSIGVTARFIFLQKLFIRLFDLPWYTIQDEEHTISFKQFFSIPSIPYTCWSFLILLSEIITHFCCSKLTFYFFHLSMLQAVKGQWRKTVSFQTDGPSCDLPNSKRYVHSRILPGRIWVLK